jgi:hypothetical protein
MRRWPLHLSPGAGDARRAGCSCSPVRNAYGRGAGDERDPVYVVADDCRYHVAGAQPVRMRGRVT